MAKSWNTSKNKYVSNVITWEDRRCTNEFLATLHLTQTDIAIFTGFGCASLFWLQRNYPFFNFGVGGGGPFVRFELRFAAIDMPTLACEQQTYFRTSLLSLRYFSEGEKRRLEIHLLFAGYANPC